MLERLAAWFLNTYVADYVGNVDTDQLSIGLLKGAVELEKLPLKKDALRKLKLPIDIKSGYIGKLKLQIPVRYIKSQPWVIQIDQLYVVAGPAQPHTYNAAEEEAASQARKQAKLDKLEERWKAEQRKSSSWWFWSPLSVSFPSNVIANLQVVVNDVHIRYEDSEADPAHPFAIGMLLDRFSAQSTDKYWEPMFTSGEDMAWKLMDLKNFAVYFDHELLGNLEGNSLIEAIMKKRGSVSTQQEPMTTSHMVGLQPTTECIIKPVSGQARLTRNCSSTPLRISDGPRLHLDVRLEEIPLSLSDNQYRLFLRLASSFKMRVRANKFKKFRPGGAASMSVLGHGRAWWGFAQGAALSRIRRRNQRSSLQFALRRARQNVLYVRGYTQHLTEETLSEEVKQQLKEIEKEQSFEELVVLRTLVMNCIKKERDLAQAAQRMISSTGAGSQGGILKSWFPGWISGSVAATPPPGGESGDPPSSSASQPSGGEASGETPSSEEEQLLNELGYEAKDNPFLRDRIFLTLNFSLSGGSFQLVTTPTSVEDSFYGPESMLELCFKSLCFSADLRPRLKYGSFDLSLGSVTVMDHSDSKSLFPVLVQPKEEENSSSEYVTMTMIDQIRRESLFGLKFVAEEVNKQILYQLKVHSKPLDIVYNPTTLAHAKQFLASPLAEQQPISQWGGGRHQDHTYSTTLRDKLEGMLGGAAKATSHRFTSIKLDISAPHLILPEDVTNQHTSVVVLDLGHVTFGNVLEWACDTVGVDVEPGLDDDDDDEFQTPPSSPPSEEEETDDGGVAVGAKSTPVEAESLQSALHSASALKQLQLPHERYILRLSDLQVLVGRREEVKKCGLLVGGSEGSVDSMGGVSEKEEVPELHLLDKFTLSVKIQRTLKFESEAPTLNLAADLPSLRFQIDEKKVHALLSCLQAVALKSKSIFKSRAPTHQQPQTSQFSHFVDGAEKAKKGGGVDLTSSIGASMYHSAVESLFGTTKEEDEPSGDVRSTESHEGERKGSREEKERRTSQQSSSNLAQRLLVASEKQISAKLFVTEILLSLSSKGRVITELSVPGISVDFLQRPHDLALRLLVQDLCLVDRIQTFGPEYELVICSSGRSLLGLSPPVPRPQSSFGNLNATQATPTAGGSNLRWNASMASLSADIFEEAESGCGSRALLSLMYTLVKPHSPQHPANLEGEELGKEEGLEGERKAVIHRVNVQCTAVDAIANQDTIIELLGFFQRALPADLLPELGGQIRHLEHLKLPARDRKNKRKEARLQAEVNISFERLGVRMLRRQKLLPPHSHSNLAPPTTKGSAPSGSSSLIASFMLYGLSAEGRISRDISIQGRLDGVQIRDISTTGKRYPDILSVGIGDKATSSKEQQQQQHQQPEQNCLSFSIHRSSRSSVTLSSGTSLPSHSDVHLAVFVPAIHYLHSVNFVYEMEMFVSEFFKYITSALANTVRSAAVGVAKGLVRQESQLVKGLSKLHTSFGHTHQPEPTVLGSIREGDDFDGGEVSEETDTGVPFGGGGGGNKLYFDISVQSPVITIPSSLKSSREDCLVAHLGEITLSNEYLTRQNAGISPDETTVGGTETSHEGGGIPKTVDSFMVTSFSSSLSPSVERMVLAISNISLHATHSEESRLLLERFSPASQGQPSYPSKCDKVLKEVSIVLEIDRQLKQKGAKGHQNSTLNSASSSNHSCSGIDSDPGIKITGKVCDPLHIELPKGVFDQLKTTLKYGIRREPKRRPKFKPSTSSGAPTASPAKNAGEKTVQFDPVVQIQESTVRSPRSSSGKGFPTISASFTLPKLSLDLKHVIDSQDRGLVYVSLDDLSVQYHQSHPRFLAVDLALKSIIIEDLLQTEDSEYRNILTSSSKPLPFPLSPVQPPGKNLLRSVSGLSGLGSPFPQQLFPLSHLMSTPKPPSFPGGTGASPLRSFSPSPSREGVGRSRSFGGQGQDETGSTLKGEGSTCSDVHSDLLTVKAFYVDQKHPQFKDTYDSISLHADVDFSSVFVIINLQTWVLLLDFLGIGIPTPPPSRPDTPTEDRSFSELNEMSPRDKNSSEEAQNTKTPKKATIDDSLLQDSRDMLSLGADPETENTMYMSSNPTPLRGEEQAVKTGDEGTGIPKARVMSDLSSVQEAYTNSVLSSGGGDSGGSSVWGVEGKLSVLVKLNVNSLTVTFNKPEHPLARGSVRGVTAQVKLTKGNMEISGSLGQGSVLDMTETGAYYRERYGKPDPLMERPYDIQVKVEMASVRYLHTMRYLKEILAFISHFPQLIDAFQRMKAIAEGNLVYNGPERKARISFDVNITNPILLLPKHAFSPDLMVGDIGHLTVSNATLYDGEAGTISHMSRQQSTSTMQYSTESVTGTAYGGERQNLAASSGIPSGPHRPWKLLSPQASSLSSALNSSQPHPNLPISFKAQRTPNSDLPSVSSPQLQQPNNLQTPRKATNGIFSSPCDPKPNLDDQHSVPEVSEGLPTVEEDRYRVERLLEIFRGPCLLDCIEVNLSEVDVFSAKRVPARGEHFRIERDRGNVLKEKGAAKLYIERNLYEDFCRDVPDLRIEGCLQAIHVMLDKPQLELIKGLVEMNLGETIEEFEKPSTVIRDPIAQPMVADVWTGLLFRMQFVGVQMEFLRSRQTEVQGSVMQSLCRFDIHESEFTFESRSNQCKTVDLSSNAVIGYDTRYESYADQDKPSVFEEVLRPRFNFRKSEQRRLQIEIHVFISPTEIKASILLNKLRLVGIFDLLLELKCFIIDKIEEDLEDDDDDVDELDSAPRPLSRMPEVAWSLRRQLASRARLHLKKPEDKPPRRVSVKLSVTETDFVVLEDVTSLDSNAVVLKGTLILKFHSIPDREKVLNCSIDSLELFSCSLSNEDETALSILDPVTITLEIKPQDMPRESHDKNGKPRDLSGSGTVMAIMPQVLEVEVQQLNFRLSYNDIKLFLAIAQSLPSLGERQDGRTGGGASRRARQKEVDELLVKRLVPLGFTRSDIRKELYLSQQEGQDADVGVAPSPPLSPGGAVQDGEGGEEKEKEEGKVFSIQCMQVNVGAMSVCLIDDCVDHDVPLLDFSLADIQAEHNFLAVKKGRARAVFAGDYYNRHISAWEPVLEPWMCELAWRRLSSEESLNKTCLSLTSKEQLNVNMTSSLIHILRITQDSWTRDLQQHHHKTTPNSSRPSPSPSSSSLASTPTAPHVASTTDILMTHRRSASGRVLFDEPDSGGVIEGGEKSKVTPMERGLALLHSVRFVSQTRQRTRFVPFLLRNNTGLPLKFATLTSVPSKVYVSPFALYQKTRTGIGGGGGVVGRTGEWVDVPSGGEQPFDFSTKGKMRHRDTRELVVHQLLVKVAGWQSIDIPVSVDKIGVFFREVWPSSDTDLDLISELPAGRGCVRLVFAISLSDVQKVVNVRSALVLSNTMEIPLEVKLERSSEYSDSNTSEFGTKSVNLPVLAAMGYLAIPIHLTSWDIFVRPQHWGVQYCSKHLPWRHVTNEATPTSHARSCDAIGEDLEGNPPLFQFCVSVKRDSFPSSSSDSDLDTPTSSSSLYSHPAHTLTLLPPLTVVNLLPCDLQLSVVESRHYRMSEPRQRRLVPKGGSSAVFSVDSQQPMELDVALESFERCQGCVVSLDRVGFPQGVLLEDYQGRSLRLTVTTEMMGGCALKVSILCPYWLINRTGLPLVFRQEGVSHEAAGQLEEHEKASTTTPLLFAYSEGEFVEKCSMRLGREYRSLNGRPLWCTPFRMVSDCGVCRVFVRSKDDRPDQEFQIGVDIQRGKGKYRLTKVVTFVAHYQLVNRTQYKLAYLQRHQVMDEGHLQERGKVPTIMPGAMLPFHWPRTDLDQLLCIRVVDIQDSKWSGGFILDKDSSFHVNVRSAYSYSAFIRCQVTLKGATYHVIFSDAASYPPPFRLENLSQTPISCCQEGAKSSLTVPLNPGQSVPYSWDEHTLPERLCVGVKGEGQVVCVDLERFGSKDKIYYESYFYIVAFSTFPTEEYRSFHVHPASSSSSHHHRRAEESTELVLDVPQGTAVIFQKKDAEKRTQLWRMSASRQLVHISSSNSATALASGTSYVLDIAGGRLPSGAGQFEPLVLRRSSTVRAASQTWKFSQNGRLLLDQSPHLCVQSPSGFQALREGADAVLGHVKGGRGSTAVSPEQEIRRMKHSPGSGVLAVAVVPDGPTRILRVTDENKKYSHTSPRDDWIVVENGQVAPSKTSDVDNCLESSWDSDDGIDTPTMELEVSLVLEEGVGVSLINAVPEELIYATLRGIKVEFDSRKESQSLTANVQHIQVDNKLAACHTPVMAYPTPSPSGEAESSVPVLILKVEKIPYKSPYALVFKVAEVRMRDMTVTLEEKLLFKLLQWAGVGRRSSKPRPHKEAGLMSMLSYRSTVSAGPHSDSMQLYCEDISIDATEMRISVSTTSQLPEDLKAIKYHLGFPLIKFQSPVKLRGYQRSHMLGEVTVYMDSLMKHYKKVIKAQAIHILGSVDFLGNPMGLVSDVASGVSGMISVQPDVVGLVRNVAHGMSDTTSKLTGTVSHVLGKATFDSSYQEEREQILESCQTSGDHLKAGLMGLSSGVFGGMTSIVTQPIKEAKSYGFGGFFTGLAKGVVSTVAKPVAGLFDLASETSAAIRETTSRVSRQHPPPVRLTRCCVGANGALTPFSISQARGQEYLLRLTDGKLTEKLVSYELLFENQTGKDSRERMRVIISSQYLYFFQQSPPDPNSLDNKFSLDELAECKPATAKSSIPTVYIVLSLIDKPNSYNAPKYKCSDEKTAKKVSQLINYAKNLHEEEKHIVRTFRLQEGTMLW